MTDRLLDGDETTRLVTSLTYLGAGETALKELQQRIDSISRGDERIVVGEITTGDDGRPVCGISFNCGSYDPPVDGVPDPRAMEDLQKILTSINFDSCLSWKSIELLTNDNATV